MEALSSADPPPDPPPHPRLKHAECDAWCEYPVADRPNAVRQFLDAAKKDPSLIKVRAGSWRWSVGRCGGNAGQGWIEQQQADLWGLSGSGGW